MSVHCADWHFLLFFKSYFLFLWWLKFVQGNNFNDFFFFSSGKIFVEKLQNFLLHIVEIFHLQIFFNVPCFEVHPLFKTWEVGLHDHLKEKVLLHDVYFAFLCQVNLTELHTVVQRCVPTILKLKGSILSFDI